MPKTRKERRSAQREGYLQGKARHPYSHTPDLDRSLTEASGSSRAASGVCNRCSPILSRYVEVFKSLVHQGTLLRKRKHVHPNPKHTDAIPYRDLKRQNEWLVVNIFDSLGNYLDCQPCVVAAFGISRQRLARLRNVKREMSQHPVVDMTKEEAEEQRLGDFVIMPAGTVTAFMIMREGSQ